MFPWSRPAATAAMLCLLAGCEPGNSYVEPPPEKVTVANPLQRAVPVYVHYTGTTQAVKRVDVRARVKGFLKERRFTEGDIVKENEVLFLIDDTPFRVALDQARARLAEATAALEKAEQSRAREVARSQVAVDQAQLLLAQIDETRSRALYDRKASSREELEKAEATRKKNAAQVEADRASLEQSEADYRINIDSARANIEAARNAVRTAEIDLDYCTITAPCEGKISRSEVDVGNLVGDSQPTLLATIHKIDPIYAYMYVSEDDLLRARKAGGKGSPGGRARPALELEMGLSHEEGYSHKGRVDYTDPGVDPGTGTIRIRGIFENPGGAVLPGLFVRVRGKVETRPDALLVPARALGYDQAGDYLLVVGKDTMVERRQVRPGDAASEWGEGGGDGSA